MIEIKIHSDSDRRYKIWKLISVKIDLVINEQVDLFVRNQVGKNICARIFDQLSILADDKDVLP